MFFTHQEELKSLLNVFLFAWFWCFSRKNVFQFHDSWVSTLVQLLESIIFECVFSWCLLEIGFFVSDILRIFYFVVLLFSSCWHVFWLFVSWFCWGVFSVVHSRFSWSFYYFFHLLFFFCFLFLYSAVYLQLRDNGICVYDIYYICLLRRSTETTIKLKMLGVIKLKPGVIENGFSRKWALHTDGRS